MHASLVPTMPFYTFGKYLLHNKHTHEPKAISKMLNLPNYPSVTLTRRGVLGNAVWKHELRNFNLVT